jgi:retron-type reverse transcriptase
MKRYGNLFQKIVSFDNLIKAAYRAFRGKKHKTVVRWFYFYYEYQLLRLKRELTSRTYLPRPLQHFLIRDPKLRLISAPAFRDRVLHHAICNIIEPILEKGYIDHSYACRVGKGTHRTIKQVKGYCQKYGYFLKCDIKKYFQSIDHKVLKKLLDNKFKDPRLKWLLDTIIDSSNDTVKGIPIGSLTSQHFANFYLNQLDHYIKDELAVKGYLRYMDDFLLFGNDKVELHVLKAKIEIFLNRHLQLQLKEKATIIAPVYVGIPFLGFRVFPGYIRLKQENKRRSLKKFKRRVKEFREGIISEGKYAQSLMSINEYFKIGKTYHLRRNVYDHAFI